MIKRIALVGRARVGKSRICAEFCKSEKLVLKYFTGAGSDCTPVNFRFVIKKEFGNDEKETIKFYSSGSTLNGMNYDFDDDGVNRFLNSIKNNNKYSASSELSDKNGEKVLNPKEDYIEIIARPSDWAVEKIMGENISKLIIIDTPGVSGDVEGLQNVNDADVYLFVMRPENNKEFATSVNKMIPIVAGSSVMYIYNMNWVVEDESDYEDMEKDARKAMKDFLNTLAGIRKGTAVIDSSIEVLNPDSTVISMGTFHNKRENLAEVKFKETLAKALKRKFNNNELNELEDIIKEALEDVKYDQETLIKYIKEVVNQYLIDYSSSNNINYVQTFLLQKHDRVKFNDNEVTLTVVNSNRRQLLKDLYDSYKSLTVNNSNINKIAKILQETIIKYCYKKITIAIKNDCGMSRGNHPFESQPPITMWAEEAIIADDIIKNNGTANANAYCNIMTQKGYKSKSWNYVSVSSKPYEGDEAYCNKKLQVISKCKLNSLPSQNLKEVVYNAYNLALFKLGQYSIFDFVIKCIKSNDDAINWI